MSKRRIFVNNLQYVMQYYNQCAVRIINIIAFTLHNVNINMIIVASGENFFSIVF